MRKPWYDSWSKTLKAYSEKQGKRMAQIQETIALEGTQKGKKQIHHNDKMQKRDHIHTRTSVTTRNSKKLYQLITKLAKAK